MRRLRRFLSTEIYFVTIRTVEQRFALSPYACPDAWLAAEGRVIDDEERRQMFERGRECVKRTRKLTKKIARAEDDEKGHRPSVPITEFTDSIPNIIGSSMARGIDKYKVQLYGFVWMSNHGHLLLQAPKDNLDEFMAYLNGQIAVSVNRFLGRENHLWARRYSAAQVLDEDAMLERLIYMLANPQNAGLVQSIEEWPGLSSGSFFFKKGPERFLCFNRTAWYKSGRPNDIAPFLSTVKLEHALLPCLAKLDRRALKRKLRKLLELSQRPASILNDNPSMRSGATDLSSLPPSRIRLRPIIPTERPLSATAKPQKNRTQQPLCHTTKTPLRDRYRQWDKEFRIAYWDCSRAYREGDVNVEFPPGSFAPSKYPRARHPANPDKRICLHPTRNNLELAELHEQLAG